MSDTYIEKLHGIHFVSKSFFRNAAGVRLIDFISGANSYITPNRNFLVLFVGISGTLVEPWFVWFVLARLTSRTTKVPRRYHEGTTKVRLGIYRAADDDIVAISDQ